MHHHRLRTAVAAVVSAVTMLSVAGCTGVPSSSAPITIKPVAPDGPTTAQQSLPAAGARPRPLVQAFLAAAASVSGSHASARAFLSPAASSRWLDSTVTIVSGETVGTFNPKKPEVVVSGHVVGTLNAAGIYTPSLQGTGDGGAAVPFVFGIKRVNGEYRIDSLRNGLVLTVDQFQAAYAQRNLYFFDLAEQYLVPDARWSSLDDSSQLATWLVTQLAAGPRPDLQNAVTSDTLPTQATARRVSVSVGTNITVEIPGTRQLDPGSRDRLATQLGETLAEVVSPTSPITITDGGISVRIPAASGTSFTAGQVDTSAQVPSSSGELVYLNGGRVVTSRGRPIAGPLSSGSTFLTSVAVSRAIPGVGLSVAGVTGQGANARLVVGTQLGGLRATSVRGTLTRPAWAPRRAEVWIGNGKRLRCVVTNGRTSRVLTVSLPSTAANSRIVALRLSPEGSRIAMVLASSTAAQQLFVGAIVRGAGQVRVDTLVPVSPEGTVITDVAWLEPLKLFAIGYDSVSQDAHVYETGVDGSEWESRGIGQLADPPDTATIVPGQLAWVSAGGFVWEQTGSNWESPGATGQTPGTAPVYRE